MGEQAAGQDDRAADVGVRQEQRELVATDSERSVGMPDRGSDQRAELRQQLIANSVAARVIDALELVDVDEHERERGAVAPGAVDHAPDRLLERAVVAQAGQAVAQRGLARALVQLVQPRPRGLQLRRRAQDLAGHPDGERDQQQEHRAQRTERLDGQRDERDRRRHDDLPAIESGQPDGRAAVGVVRGHRREVEHLARDGARVELAVGLGEDRAGWVGDLKHPTGHLQVRRGVGQ